MLLHLHKGVYLRSEGGEEEEDEIGVEEATLEMRRHANWLHQAARRYQIIDNGIRSIAPLLFNSS